MIGGGSGAWIGEVNFLDGEKSSNSDAEGGPGAIATFVTDSPARYLSWKTTTLRALIREVRMTLNRELGRG